MRLLLEISDKDLGIDTNSNIKKLYRIRKSARAVVFNDKKEMALQRVGNYRGEAFHKLPGGGVKSGETIEQALYREVSEEVGCKIGITEPVGVIFEARGRTNLFQINYCYIAFVDGLVGEPRLERAEIKFMHTRDLAFMREAQKQYCIFYTM